MFDNKKFVYFVLTRPALAGWSFNSYEDNEGEIKFIEAKKDIKTGEPILRRFKFTPAQRVVRIPKHQKDIVEFLRNAPYCEGSKNGRYGEFDSTTGKKKQFDVYYKEMAEGKDAKIAVDALKNKLKAENAVMELEGDNLRDAATMIGEFREDESLQMHSLLRAASSDPDRVLGIINKDDFKARAFVRRAVRAKVIEVRGGVHYHKEVNIGIDEDEAVATILKNAPRRKSIENQMKNLGA